MAQDKLQEAVLDALKHYNKLEGLQVSPLGELEAIWPLPPSATQDLIASHATGLAVRRLLDRAIERLGQGQPEAACLLDEHFCQEKSIQQMSKQQNLTTAALYVHRKKAISRLTGIIADIAAEGAEGHQQKVYRQTQALPAAFGGPLVGFESYLNQVCAALRAGVTHSNLLVITGLGGIGKTSLTCQALRSWLRSEAPPIERVLWATIEQSSEWAEPVSGAPPFDPSTGSGHRTSASSVHRKLRNRLERVLWQLGSQLELPIGALPNNQQRLKVIASHLAGASQRFVMVIDNVETPTEAQLALRVAEAALPLAQVVITSRRDISHNQAQLLRLRELSEQHALELLRLEALRRGMMRLSDDEAQQLYKEIGGHPLALKLAVGQASRMPVAQVLSALHRHSPLADELYTHVYETSWHLLSELSREVLLALMLLPISGANWQALRLMTPTYDDAALEEAITELSTLNLLQIFRSTQGVYTYSLHRLTYCFLEHKTGMAKSF